MTDVEINYQNMALAVRNLLHHNRPEWEPRYGKMLPNYTLLSTALDELDAKVQQRSGQGSRGYTEAKDLAEIAALDAAMPVLQGVKTLAHDGQHPALGQLAKHTRSSLDGLRGPTQVATLEDLHSQALAVAAELAEERVTASHLEVLNNAIEAYRPLLGTPRAQINTGALLREDAVQLLGQVRRALAALDLRVPNLHDELPELVAAYRKARQIIDAGHGPKEVVKPQA
jgi:hypothetical protein